MADRLLSSSAMLEAADMPMDSPGMKVEKLYKIFIPTFANKETLKVEENHTIGNPIVKDAGDIRDPNNHDSGLAGTVSRSNC